MPRSVNRNKRKIRQMRQKLAEFAKNCNVCGLSLKDPLGPNISIDHWYPASLGGPTLLWNLRLAHKRCNSSKGSEVDPQAHAAFLRWCQAQIDAHDQ